MGAKRDNGGGALQDRCCSQHCQSGGCVCPWEGMLQRQGGRRGGSSNCHLRLTAVAPPPKPQAPPTNAAEVKAAAGVKEAPAVNTPDRHPRPLARAHEKRRERLAQEESQRYCDLLQSTWEEIHASRCKMCYNEFTKSDQSNYRRREWVVQLISCCMTCIELDE